MTEPRVVVAGTLPAAGLELLRARFAVELAGELADFGSLRTVLPGAAAIVVRPGIIVDGELLDCAGDSLRVVSSFGVGYDHIDLEAARVRRVRVTNTPGVLTDATAELAVALMLAAARRLAEGDGMVRRGEWRGGDPNAFLGRSLVGATVGLIGFRPDRPAGRAAAARLRRAGAVLRQRRGRRRTEPNNARWKSF